MTFHWIENKAFPYKDYLNKNDPNLQLPADLFTFG